MTSKRPLKFAHECITDITFVCEQIVKFVEHRGMTMSLSPNDLHKSIVRYIFLRQYNHRYAISKPVRKTQRPPGWTRDYEDLWRDWLDSHADAWITEVMDPVFGTNEKPWEVDGWRTEIFTFLPWWIMRSIAVLQQRYPSLFEKEEIEESNNKKEVDIYLVENGIIQEPTGAHSMT
jgi:hypothetical protein